jgi:hypothetical protein
MAFLHNRDGQVYQSARPKQLTAAAELGELALTGYVGLDDDTIVVGRPVAAGERPWMAEAVAELPEKPVRIDAWIRKRHDSVTVQQQAALDRGVLEKDRAKLAGLIGYDRHLVNEGVREALLTELDAPDAASTARAAALAKLLLTPGVKRVLGFDSARLARLAALAESAGNTPLPGALFTAMDYAIASAVAPSVFGD